MGKRESPAGYHFYSSYQDCPKKWFFKYIMGLLPYHTGPALIYGAAIHEAMEEYYNNMNEPNIREKMVICAQNHLDSRQDEFKKPSDYQERILKAESMLNKWYDTWAEKDKLEWDVLEVEKQHEIKFGPNDELLMTIRVDCLKRNKITREVAVFDAKTTSWSVCKAVQGCEQKDQMTAYIWGINKVYPELKCHVAIPDIIYQRGSVVKAERPVEIYRDQFDLNAFELEMYGLINEISQKVEDLKNYPRPLLFPRHGAHCENYGCEYKDICRANIRMGDLPVGFTRDEWYQEEVARNVKEINIGSLNL